MDKQHTSPSPKKDMDKHKPGCRCLIIEHWHHCTCCEDLPPDPCREKDCTGGNGNGNNGGNPNRPGKTPSTDRGRLGNGTGLTKGDLTTDFPPDSWPGQRKDMYCAFLYMRQNAGDLGTRLNPDGTRMPGVFWESPDILLLAGVHPDAAPARPPALGETALAHQPNTVYAHIWNFGKSKAPQVVVEFYWCNPSLGINPGSTHMFGCMVTSLGARGSGDCHKLVKCPEPWVPEFLNGGHECLLVRVWDFPGDALGKPEWDASINRHIGQRNIHVSNSLVNNLMKPMGADVLRTPALETPLVMKVGPLYGAPAQVNLTRVSPGNMPWLQLHTGVRGKFPLQAAPTGTAVLSRPVTIGGSTPTNGAADQHTVHGDDQEIAFTTTDLAPAPGEAHVYRVAASQGGQVFGGYTIVLVGS